MADVVELPVRQPPKIEIVTRAKSYEWADVWGYLPDPDPVLDKAGYGVEVYDQLLADPHVWACYQSRKAGVLNSEFKLTFPKGTEKTAEFFDSLIKRLPMETLIGQLLDAPFYGFSVCEIIWTAENGKWIPAAIEQKPNRWFVFDKQNRLRFLSKRDQMNGELLPDFKFLVPRNFPTYENPYGIRVLSRCFWPVAFKKATTKYWVGFVEKYGIPWLIAKVPRATPKEQREELLTQLEAMVQSAVGVVNDDEAVEAINLSQQGRGNDNVFSSLINAANAEISKAILTQTLTTEIGNKGAYAASQSHLAVRNELCSGDKKLVAGAFDTLFTWCAWFNFGLQDAPKMKFIEDDEAKEEHARRDTQLFQQGVRFEPEYYERTYNLRPGEFKVEDPIKLAEAAAKAKAGPQAEEAKQKRDRVSDRKDPKKSTKEKN